MTAGKSITLDQMKRLIEFFTGYVKDQTTLNKLHMMIADPHSWPRAHDLFRSIRQKTLAAERNNVAQAVFV